MILIAGFGSIGQRHFRNLRALGFRRFAFLRTGMGTLDDAEASEFPSFRDLQDALELKPDITVVANPTALHLAVALGAARAGSHLFVEKPLAHQLEGCAELEAIARERGLVTMIGCQFRFHPLLRSLRRQLEDGRIGKVISARAEYGEFLPGWHPWEDHRKGYSAREDLGGGVILTLIHPLDYLYWLFGEVEDVHASISKVAMLNTLTRDDLAEITLDFRTGVIGQVHLDFVQQPPVHTVSVLGEKGMAVLDFLGAALTWHSADGATETETAPPGFDRNTMFMAEMEHFIGAVEDGNPACIPVDEGRAVLEIALRAKMDAMERR